MAKLEGPQKRKIQDWRVRGAPMCSLTTTQNGGTLARKPLCWETKANRKRRGWKRASCILIRIYLKEPSTVGRQSEPALEVKTR